MRTTMAIAWLAWGAGPAWAAPTLDIRGSCPGTLDIQVTSVTPRARIAVLASPDLGTTDVSLGPCANAATDLHDPTVRGQLRASRNGRAVLSTRVPAGACGLHLQALDTATCLTSAPLRLDGRVACELPDRTYIADAVFTDADPGGISPFGLAWDGTNLWTVYGGWAGLANVARYDAAGAYLSAYAPANFDPRSAFTKGDGVGPVFVRSWFDSRMYQQISPGQFAWSVSLSSGSTLLDANGAVVFDPRHQVFVAAKDGVLTQWDGTTGLQAGSRTLVGYGSGVDELTYPQNLRVAFTDGGCALTYSAGVLSSWDFDGQRVSSVPLIDVLASPDTPSSASYAQGLFWVLDGLGGTWRGYDLDL